MMDVVAPRHRTRLRHAAGRYRDARRSLHTPSSAQSRRGLDWMNFFIADVQTGFGTFVAFYLAQIGWSQGSVGIILAAGGLAGVFSQIPGGAVADAVIWKRGLAALGIVMTGAAAIILAFAPNFFSVLFAQILQGATAGVLTPAIGAISLGLVGRPAIAVRAGRNYRYAAAGHALTAALMGAVGAYVAKSAIFVAAAALCIPALIALSFIRSDEIDYARARNAKAVKHDHGTQVESATRIFEVCKNHKLVLFIAATVLFQFADASMLPLIGENLATARGLHAALWMSGLIIVPQVVGAILAPWVGFHSEKRGRRPLLLIGFGLEPVRALLLAFTSSYPFLLLAQGLSGVTGALIGVLTTVIITDLTAGTGRFNLAMGVLGTLSGVAASLSTGVTGYVFQTLGQRLGYLPLAFVAAAATVLLWMFLSETKPTKFD
ncbi:MAG: MFS transporter [Bradyrhizobium sp.]|nr:MFS transporter [Bradyrhizobium sp.]